MENFAIPEHKSYHIQITIFYVYYSMIHCLWRNYSITSNNQLVLQNRDYKLSERSCELWKDSITAYFIGFHLVNVPIHIYRYTHTHIFYNNNNKNDNILLNWNSSFIHLIFFYGLLVSKNVIHTKTWILDIIKDFQRHVM